MGAVEIARGIYLVGGPEISHAEDATAFVIDFDGELVMVDCGAGRSVERIIDNVEEEGLDPAMISTLILTHAHIDHIGAAPALRQRLGCRILIHEMDADAVEAGDPVRTAADWYGIAFPPTPVDRRLKGDEETSSVSAGRPSTASTPRAIRRGPSPSGWIAEANGSSSARTSTVPSCRPSAPTSANGAHRWKSSLA